MFIYSLAILVYYLNNYFQFKIIMFNFINPLQSKLNKGFFVYSLFITKFTQNLTNKVKRNNEKNYMEITPDIEILNPFLLNSSTTSS